MATLQKIRTRAGVLVAIVIGLALFAFILGDFLQSGSSVMRRNQMEIGTVNGETIQYPDFQRQVEELGEIYKSNTDQRQIDEPTWVQIREQTWQNLLRDNIMVDVYDHLGMAVTSEELFDMLQGKNPHPIVQQIFTNPETGAFDRSAVVNFLKNLETGVTPEQRSYWLYLEKQILSERLQSKYQNLINKAMVVTDQEAQQSLEAKNKQVNFEMVALRQEIIADSLVKVTPKEMTSYYEAHQNDFKDEKTRTIEYVVYRVVPSESDYTNAEKWINDIKDDFSIATDNIQFVNSNSDVSFDGTWHKMNTLGDSLDSWIFSKKAAVNDIYGPYFENESYKLAKLNASEMMPDSVQARHILLKVSSAAEATASQSLADSLKKVIDNGGNFAELARLYSTDTGSAINGGDLGWFSRGMMVKPFEDAAFSNKVNEVKVVPSQFGIHIIQTTRLGAPSRQVQLAILERTVTPSTQTYQSKYALAGKFTSENLTRVDFDAAIEKEKLTKEMKVLHENDLSFGGFENARILIRAAFSGKTGTILKNTDGSPIFELGDNFVVAILTGATEEGISPLQNVKARVELAVQKEKKKDLLAERMKTAAEGKTDMYAIASALGSEVSIVSAINFNSAVLPDYGMEPYVIGAAVSMEPNVVSSPLKGNNGVFLIKVTSIEESGDTNVAAEKEYLLQSYGFRAMQAFDVLKEKSEIVDKRPKFY